MQKGTVIKQTVTHTITIRLTDKELSALNWALDMVEGAIEDFWYRADNSRDYGEGDQRRFKKKEKQYRRLLAVLAQIER